MIWLSLGLASACSVEPVGFPAKSGRSAVVEVESTVPAGHTVVVLL